MKNSFYCQSLVLGAFISGLSGNAEASCPKVAYDTFSHIQNEGELIDLEVNGVPYRWGVVGVDQLPGDINQMASNKMFSIENTEIREEGAPKQACVYKYHTVASKAKSAFGGKRYKFTLIRIVPAAVVESLATIGSNDTSTMEEIKVNFDGKMQTVENSGGNTDRIQRAFYEILEFVENGLNAKPLSDKEYQLLKKLETNSPPPPTDLPPLLPD